MATAPVAERPGASSAVSLGSRPSGAPIRKRRVPINKITFPLKRHMQRLEVGDLQDTLQLLLNRGALLANDVIRIYLGHSARGSAG